MIFIMCAVCAYVQLVHALCVMCVVFGGGGDWQEQFGCCSQESPVILYE